MAKRSRVKSSTAVVMASGGNAGFNRPNAARNREINTTSPFVSRPSEAPSPIGLERVAARPGEGVPKVSSNADTVAQPSSANSPMAGCSTSPSSV